MPPGRRASGPGASRRHGTRGRLGGGNHNVAGRGHHHGGLQLCRHAGEREGARQAAAAAAATTAVAAAAAAAAELRPERQSAETEAAQDALHSGATQRAGAELCQNALPRHLYEGGAGAADRPHRVQSAGKQ